MGHTEAVCLCGASRISYDAEPIVKFRCHCVDERRLSGNGFCNNYLLNSETLKTVEGGFKTWAKVANNGNEITSHFCGTCGSLIYRVSSGYPGTFVLKVGNVDDDGKTNANFVPDVEIFTRTRVQWVPAVEGAKQEVADFT